MPFFRFLTAKSWEAAADGLLTPPRFRLPAYSVRQDKLSSLGFESGLSNAFGERAGGIYSSHMR